MPTNPNIVVYTLYVRNGYFIITTIILNMFRHRRNPENENVCGCIEVFL